MAPKVFFGTFSISVIFYLVFGGTKRAQFASPHLTSPWIYILRCNYLFCIRWHQNLTLCYFLFSIRGTKRAQFASAPLTSPWIYSYIMLFTLCLVFGGTKRAQFASPPLTSPWIYILHCNYLFRIRWHQNLTLCYFLFSIRWHQKCSVCFWHL